MDRLLSFGKKLIPRKLFKALQPIYHYKLALWGAIIYGFPSKKIKVVAITGTKGKTTTTKILGAILEAGGHTIAAAGTLEFKIGDKVRPNLYKMTMPGRFFVQKFLRQAVNAHCDYAILEMTSEAAVQFRHKFIDFDALIFLNISPEHIESHGGFDNYLKAKLSLAKAVSKSHKPCRIIVSNIDDAHGQEFLNFPGIEKQPFSLKNVGNPSTSERGVSFTYKGVGFVSPLPGLFTISNMLGAITYAETQHVPLEKMSAALKNLSFIRGRLERVTLDKDNLKSAAQKFTVIVDYAHTADSLEKLYTAFKDSPKICLLGNTGGGRDTWKRPEMAKVADRFAKHIILTNEDPYDEDPQKIIDEMLPGISKTSYEVIMDRRQAIKRALMLAEPGDVVILSGKGTDPYIMEAGGKKTPWDDATVVREELEKILG